MILPHTADVVIIGAGVIGCSTAYHLAKLGLTDVVVIEKEQVGSGASSKSASMLSLQFSSDALMAQMGRYSYERYMAFGEEIGVPTDFTKTGWISLATQESAEHLRQGAEMLQSLGIRTETLTPQEIKRRYPEINTDDIALGTWGPDDGPLDPHMVMSGYIGRAREMGVKLREGVTATGLQVEKGRVCSVVTDQGDVSTGVVVNAAGPWAIEVGRWVGVEIPILNLARSILVTGPFPDIPADRPFIEDVTVEWYYRPEGPGILMGMGLWPVHSADKKHPFDVHFTPEIAEEIIETAIHRVPILEKASLMTGWTGVRPLTADERPILGPTADGPEGFVLNCGWGGVGIIQAPIAGRLIAEFIHDGAQSTLQLDRSTIDLAPFRLERFTEL